MEKRINVVHVGISGVPFGKSAAINRCLGIYSILDKDEFNILAINNRAADYVENAIKVDRKGQYSNISYQYTTPTPYKPTTFFKRRLYNFLGRINEFFLLVKRGFKKEIDVMFFYPEGDFLELIFYRFFSKLFGFPLISHYVEYRSSFENRKKGRLRINDALFDKYFMYFIDGAIPISEFLIDQIKTKKKKLPILKIPPLVDFKLFSKNKTNNTTKYFLYVGSTSYYKAIETILASFELIENNEYYLYLVIHGSGMEKLRDTLKKHPKNNLIKIYSGLEYSELVQYYNNAQALLIPLSNTIKDKARFPQKISEYLASKKPIITTDFGEIAYYFQDNINALVAKTDSASELSLKMKYIINNPKEAEIIGLNGYKTGLKSFDSNAYNESLKEFVMKFIN